MVKPEKFGHLHLVCHFIVPLKVQVYALKLQVIGVSTDLVKYFFSLCITNYHINVVIKH